MTSNYIVKIGNRYRYRRRIPKTVAHLDKRKEIKISLNTSDPKIVGIRADIYNDQMEAFWSSLIEADTSTHFDQRYLTAVQLAKVHGFAYKTPEQIAASALSEITQRIYNIQKNDLGQPERNNTEALLGGLDTPNILLSDCWEIYEGLIHDRLVNKSKDQIRKWKNVKKLAINNFIKVSTVKYLHEVNRSEILKF